MTRVLDPVKNFAEVIPTGTYTAASTTINLTTGTGGTLPDVTTEGAFNLVWFNSTDYTGPALDPQKEIVRVVARTSDILTVLRGQEGTTASTKAIAGKVYKMTLAVTEHIIDQVNTQLELDKTMSDVLTASGLIGNSGKFLTTDGLTISWSNVSGAGVSTFTNLGAGSGLVAAIVGVDLQVKSIIAGTNVTITSTATAITINATGGGGGGDVYLASNNAFTGNNTHAGSETFSGVVDLSGATITYPSGTATGGSNSFGTGTTQTYATGSVVTRNSGSSDTYADESIISNQADETFGVGYEGVYQSGSTLTHNSGSTETYDNGSIIVNEATETYGAGYAMTTAAGASFDYTGATMDFSGATISGISGIGTYLSNTTLSNFIAGGTVIKYSFVIPANTISTGSIITSKVFMGSWGLGTSQFGTIQLKVGATVIATRTINATTATSNINGDVANFYGVKTASQTTFIAEHAQFLETSGGFPTARVNTTALSNNTVDWTISNTIDVVFVGSGSDWAVSSILGAELTIK